MSFLSNYNLIYFLWFLRIFKPEWLVSYIIPGTGLLRAIPTFLMYAVFCKFLISREKKILDVPYLLFCVSILLSTLFAWNFGLAQQGLRTAIDSLLFYIISISILRNDKDLDRLINLYLWGFIFFGICGMLLNGKVPFHIILSDEDAFGPYMDLGVALALFAAFRDKRIKYLPAVTALICVAGLVASFARGAFVGFCAVLLFIWYKFPQKMKISILIACAAVLVLTSATLFFPENSFWDEMQTITEASAKTESDRAFLWHKAFDIFQGHPLVGVGPRNFGWVLPRITTEVEAAARGVQVGHLYNRVTHNIYFQILSELGAIGMVSFLMMLFMFYRRNSRVQRHCRAHITSAVKHRQEPDAILRRNYYYAMAVQGSMAGYLVCGLFYDLLYYHWLVDLLIFNSLLYSNSIARGKLTKGSRGPGFWGARDNCEASRVPGS